MPDRFWDPEEKFPDALLEEYSYWILEVSYRQHTLGCFIVFAKKRVERISQLSNEALVELKDVLSEIESALNHIPEFTPDRFNYLQMGNGLHNLHFHGIPRYKTQRNFAGKKWIDETWGHPPIWTRKEIDKKLMLQIKEKILGQLK